jgi:outer membrane protein OmpA-like peptidoglycan-associated protein
MTCSAQKFTLSGNWSGILVDTASNYTISRPVVLKINGVNGHATGVFRVESATGFTQFEVSGYYKKKKDFTLTSSKKPSMESKNFGGKPFEFDFHFDDSSEYIRSGFRSPGGPYHGLQLYLERDEKEYTLDKTLLFNELSTQAFAFRVKKGVPAKAKRIKELEQFAFQPIHFEVDRYEIDSSYFPYLQKITRILNSHTDLRLRIIGHTDADGSDDYNIALSKNRANAIFQFLVNAGIASDRMVFDFKGEGNPTDTNENESGKQRNRRVEFEFI